MVWSEIIGYSGAFLAVVAYVPQLYHLIKYQCAASISVKAFGVWCIASLLLLIHAINIHEVVFIVFQGCSLVALLTILVFGYKYHDKRCALHKNK